MATSFELDISPLYTYVILQTQLSEPLLTQVLPSSKANYNGPLPCPFQRAQIGLAYISLRIIISVFKLQASNTRRPCSVNTFKRTYLEPMHCA